MSALATPAASVAGTGAPSSGAPSPSADLDNSLGTPPGGEPGGGAAAEPGAGAPPEGGQREAGSDADAGGTEQEADGDARVVPAKWREAFKNDPELKALFFERHAFKKEFPGGIQEVRALKQTLDTVGGEVGLTQIQTDLSDFRTLANQFLDGDPAYIADVFETDPVAAVSHLPAYLDATMQADEPSYNRIIAQKIYGEHQAWGLHSTLKAAYDAIATDPAKAKQLLNSIAAWDDRLKNVGDQQEDPRVKKLQEQIREGRKSADQESVQKLNASYKTESMQQIDRTATRILDSYLKGKKLSEEDRTLVMQQIIMRADKSINADTEYVKQRDASFQRARQTGDKSASVKLAVTRWEKELNIVVPKVARLFGLGSGKPAIEPAKPSGNTPPPGGADSSGFVKVTTMPDPKTIDTYRTSQSMISKQHRAILKDGKKVYWELAG